MSDIDEMDDAPAARPRRRGAGGTSGGLGEFFGGATMVGVGGWMLLNQVQVTTGYWRLWGQSAFGLSLLPLLAGITALFFNGRSTIGWLLTVIGAGIIFMGILLHLDIYFRPTSLFNTLIMLGLIAGGIGLVAKAIRPH